MKQYFYKAIIESCEEGGFSAYIPSLPGCVSEGETYEECLSNIKEAMELYIETAQELGKTILEDKAHIAEMCITI
ncbi:MAG: type II toxin-antitoxin system HicB family antitoxin [Spirochaetales bacterium]|nr:type II toxin-antitoxin system HicB family antitoxin [Spirochaetales bacterium]